MEQNNNNLSNIKHPDYNPAEDPEVEPDWEDLKDKLDFVRKKFDPYQRYIMIVGFTILIILVVYLGYARGALDVCNDLGGRLEVGREIVCHPSQYTPQAPLNDSTFIVPRLSIENVD
ncbi:hypothetical protein LCGC14_1541860 [marine sediment metagenome]|uniref:Uncharacterized protein n=1 Tax=marine sediment metagenome TaxID=412755 RepID=A0A0F9LTL5_9ZZZZ